MSLYEFNDHYLKEPLDKISKENISVFLCQKLMNYLH